MSYLYILYRNTSQGLIPEARMNLSLSAIQGIYSAQLLSQFIDYYEDSSDFYKREFSIISRDTLPAPPNNIAYEEVYDYPLNNLLDYLNIVEEIDYEAGYHSVKLNEYGDILNVYEQDPFTHVIRYYNNSDTLSNIGIKVTPSNTEEFVDGFLKYFKLAYQYHPLNQNGRAYSFEMQEYRMETYSNKYRKVGKLVFRSSINNWLFNALPKDIKGEIVQYIPKTFSSVSKGYYQFCTPYISIYCPTSIDKLSDEIIRRINENYSTSRIMEIYRPAILNNWDYVNNIIVASLNNNRPEVTNIILAGIQLNQVVDYWGASVSDIVNADLASTPNQDTANIVLRHIIGRKDYNPNLSDALSNLFFEGGEAVSRTILESGKFDPNEFELESPEPTNSSLELLMKVPGYNATNFDYTLIFIILRRTLLGIMQTSILSDVLNRPEVDPSYNNNSMLEELLNERQRNPENQEVREVVNILLSNPRLDIFRGGFEILHKLARYYPNQLIEILVRNGAGGNVSLMQEHVYPYMNN
jgi:hypothetical protein